MYRLPQSPEEIRINNYNPLLLMLWKANMDIQYIAESSLVIPEYVTGYVTKAETFGKTSPLTSPSVVNCVHSVSGVYAPECGLYEASDLLLGDHLCGKSETVKWIDVSQPHKKKWRLKDHSKLVQMQQNDPNSTDLFEDNLVDTFYPRRPNDMEDVCLYDFVTDYIKIGVDKNGKTVYQKLGNSLLPNHKLFNPNKENERESYIPYCYCSYPFVMRELWWKTERVLSKPSKDT